MDLIFLHGVAAAGKLTTARALEDLVGLPVFHNHLIVDALTPVLPFGSPAFVALRERFWLEVFAAAVVEDRSLTFTFAPEPTVPVGFAERVRRLVCDAGGRVHFVRLLVDDDEQEVRVALPSRREFAKLADVDVLRRLRAVGGDVEQPPVDLEIDTGFSSPVESARTIAAHFALPVRPRVDRYPT